MGSNLGCRRRAPADLSAACSFGPVAVRQRRVDINAAAEEELMTLPGVSRAVARDIVRHRERIGGFRRAEDLALVRGVGAARLALVRAEIRAGGARLRRVRPHVSAERPGDIDEGDALRCAAPSLPAGGPADLQWTRPPAELFAGLREGRPVLRVATWSLQRCSNDKARNPGVAEVLCMSILENGIKLLAVQDLVDREALEKFRMELNQGTLPSVRGWKGPRGVWKCAVSEKPVRRCHETSEFCGFLWDSSTGIELKDTTLMENAVINGNGNDAYPRPYLAHFRVGSSELTIVNIRLKAPVLEGETNGRKHLGKRRVSWFSDSMQEILRGEKSLLVLGDFGLPPDTRELELLKKEKLSPLIPPTVFTNISTKAPQGSCCLDNIWVSRSLKKVYTGYYRVVREGLTSPWIPDNWSWGGVASDHCPLLAEFYTHVRLQKGATQNGCGTLAMGCANGSVERER